MKGLWSFYNNNLQYFFEENIHRKNNQLLIRVGYNDKLIMKKNTDYNEITIDGSELELDSLTRIYKILVE